MKKLFALLLAVTMLFLLVSCTKDENNTNTDSETTTSQTQSSENNDSETIESEPVVDKIVNEDGEEFIVDISNYGKVKEDAAAISDNKFELAGTTYTFPIKMSELFDNGWKLSDGYEYQTEFDANTQTSLISYYLVHESGIKIILGQITNDSAEKKDIKDCILTRFSIDTYYLETDADFVLPGGIVPMSTAANILEVFGNPNTTTDFTMYSYSMDDQLTYSKHASSNISYSFKFNDDGTLYSVHINYAV
ncbi:MAG: hypothetical protein IKJ88_02855 [Clostridia bacterium]|nr:hypothetical protein [Clostridia bacterium]